MGNEVAADEPSAAGDADPHVFLTSLVRAGRTCVVWRPSVVTWSRGSGPSPGTASTRAVKVVTIHQN
jgi:hypothetical protein